MVKPSPTICNLDYAVDNANIVNRINENNNEDVMHMTDEVKKDADDISIELLGLNKVPEPVLDDNEAYDGSDNPDVSTFDGNVDNEIPVKKTGAETPKVGVTDETGEQPLKPVLNTEPVNNANNQLVKTANELTPADIDGMSPEQKANVIRFIDRMDEKKRTNIIKNADYVLDRFMEDENRINHYGDKALQAVNQVVDNKLDRISSDKEMNYPEINKIIRDMTGDFNESVEKYEKHASSFDLEQRESAMKRWIQEKMDAFRRRQFDAQSLIERFDYVEKKLASNNSKLAGNISWGQQLIEANNTAIDNLIIVTASIEAIRDIAEKKANELADKMSTIDITTPDWHRIDDERAALAVIIHDLDIKHSEYVVRLFDAHATNAQVRNIVAISQGIRQKSGQIVNSVIPQMKTVISEISATMTARSSAELIQSVQDAAESARQHLNRASLENTKYVMDIAESPTQTPESILARAKSINDQNNEFIASIENGTKRRMEVEQAVVNGIVLIDKSVRDRDARIINALMGAVGEGNANKPEITGK